MASALSRVETIATIVGSVISRTELVVVSTGGMEHIARRQDFACSWWRMG